MQYLLSHFFLTATPLGVSHLAFEYREADVIVNILRPARKMLSILASHFPEAWCASTLALVVAAQV